jgi:monovalent cation/hydrogen antiporter
MSFVTATLFLLFLTTIAVPWARRMQLPREIFLVVGSLALSLLPGLPPLILDPAVVFTIFLPPVLFAGAFFTSWRDFKRNHHSIFLLAFGLVLFTTAVVAVAVHSLGIGVPWPVAFLLGAIVSPPDASAAMAIISKLGVPRRMMTIIEGESLVNDATALVAYRIAMGAIVTGAFSLGTAAAQFVLVAAGGAAVGFMISMAGILIVQRLNDSTAETTLMLITSFTTYLTAERLGFSGVIACVAGGLYFGRKLPAVTPAQTHLESLAFGKTLLFIINGLVFSLIGLQLPLVVRGLHGYSWTQLIVYSSTIVFVVIAVRFVWIFPTAYFPRKLFPWIARGEPEPDRGEVVAASWLGMRGIVSLASALSIPLALPSGAEFPFRNLLVFLTYIVILATLLIPATTLPWLMRRLGIKDGGETRFDHTVARRALYQAVLRELDLLKKSSAFSDELLEKTASVFKRRLQALKKDSAPGTLSVLFNEERDLRSLIQRVVRAERHELERLREKATIHDAVFFQLSKELDIEEMLLQAQRL